MTSAEYTCYLSRRVGPAFADLAASADALDNPTQAPLPAAQGDARDAAKHCLEMGESFRALRRVVNLLLEARRNLGPEDHELRDRIDRLLRDDAARAPTAATYKPATGGYPGEVKA